LLHVSALDTFLVQAWTCPLNVDGQHVVTLGTGATQLRTALLRGVSSVTRQCNLDHLADRPDTVCVAALVDECPHGSKWLSSCAWTKKRTRQTQDLVCLAQLAVFTLQRLDTLLFGGRRRRALAGITCSRSSWTVSMSSPC
jgi:hypothetical protein